LAAAGNPNPGSNAPASDREVGLRLYGADIGCAPRGSQGCSGGKPKLKLENTVSKSVSSERGRTLVQITFRSQEPAFGIVKFARPS
jgi:hypothetical protein